MRLFSLGIFVSVGITSALGGTLQTVVVSKTQPSSTTCLAPPSDTSFSATDTVFLYFVVQAANASDQISAHWIDRTNAWAWTTNWNALAAGGNFCFNTSILGSQLATTGTWRAEIYIGSQLIGQTTFNLGSAGGGGGGTSNTPDYRGSFDAVDCSHAYGWAKDNNSPNSIVSVDIYVDGNRWATIQAGESRSDLAAAGIGNHAWNEYSLPSNLHDGKQHILKAAYTGTSTELPSSPKTFQDACATGPPPSNGTTWTYSYWNYDRDLHPFYIRLDKEPLGNNKFRYRLAFAPNQYNVWKLDSAVVTVVGPRSAKFARKYSRWQVTYSNSGSLLNDGAAWTDPPAHLSGDSTLAFKGLEWAMGIVSVAGDIAGFVDYANEVFAEGTAVGPSSWALGPKIDDDENFYAFHVPIDLFKAFGHRVNGAQFILDNVDENGGQPEFYLQGKDLGGHIFGIEIGLDRNALTWSKNVVARLDPF